jgi:glycosyltransferase involved in cell wall biosynthesis
MNRISACLITLNEEANLARALASLSGVADEIVVIDSGSTDRTEEIAREHGATFVVHDWTNYGEQKNFAATSASNDWIFSMDADEELSSNLHLSLLEWKKRKPDHDVYEVSRRTWYLGAWIKHSGWYPDFQRRLYRRTAAKFSGIIHESLQFPGKSGRLTGDLLHYTVRSFEDHETNVEKYSTLSAQRMYSEGRRRWRGALVVATPWSWFRSFILRRGFLDGYRGALIAKMAARTVRLKYAKLGKLVAAHRRSGTARS